MKQLCICGDPDCVTPFGFCHCGCGEKTAISPVTSHTRGRLKGQPARGLLGHANRRPIALCLWEKVTFGLPWECWLFTGARSRGYGHVGRGSQCQKVHRLAYELLVGPIPEGLTLDHLCRIRNCVNPVHLEPVTQRVNTLRGTSIAAQNAAKTHCKRGHEFTPENTIRQKHGRSCRTCDAMHRRRYRLRDSEAAKKAAEVLTR